jgi:hypothetical protein
MMLRLASYIHLKKGPSAHVVDDNYVTSDTGVSVLNRLSSLLLYCILLYITMATQPVPATAEDLEQANKIASTDPTKAEELYRGILSHQTSKSSTSTLSVG